MQYVLCDVCCVVCGMPEFVGGVLVSWLYKSTHMFVGPLSPGAALIVKYLSDC